MHGPTGRAVAPGSAVDVETWARRHALLLALPAYVADVGAWKRAARELAVPVRTLARWIAAARELAACVDVELVDGAPVALVVRGTALSRCLPFQGETGAVARAALADWLDARREGGA